MRTGVTAIVNGRKFEASISGRCQAANGRKGDGRDDLPGFRGNPKQKWILWQLTLDREFVIVHRAYAAGEQLLRHIGPGLSWQVSGPWKYFRREIVNSCFVLPPS